MSEAAERAIARLSITAFAVDALVVTLMVAVAHQVIEQNFQYAPQWLYIVVIPLMLLIHFLIVELLAMGISVGRLSCGIRVVSEDTGTTPGIMQRFRRCLLVLSTLGLRSLNIHRLPAYNRHPSGLLASDWAGPASAVTRTTNGRRDKRGEKISRMEPTPVTGITRGETMLQVTEGPHSGQTAALRTSKRFQEKGLYIIGRKPGVDLVLSKDPNVSAVHCHIRAQNRLFYLIDGAGKDKPSTNGTKLNKKIVGSNSPVVLKNGDEIRLGGTALKVIFI